MTSLPLETKKAGSWSSLAVLLVGNFVTILDLFIINVALPDIQHELHTSNAGLQLIIVAYEVPYGALLLNAARLGDLYGRRLLFLTGMAVFALSSLACALAPSSWALIAARAVQGGGAALLMPQVYTSLRLLFEGEERRRALAVMGAVQGVAGAASQVIGGYLIALDIGGLGWRLIFLVNLPIALYALIAGRWLITETRSPLPAKLDIGGAAMGASTLTLVLLPLTMGRDNGWPWWMIASIVLSIPAFACFACHEARLARRGGVPIIAMSLFGKESFNLGILATFLFFSAIGSLSLSLTILLQVGLGLSPLEAGMLFLPSTIAFFTGSLLSAPLARKWGRWAPLAGMLVFAIGLAIAIVVGLDGGEDLKALSLSLILNGLGQGIVMPLLLDMILSTVSNDEAGMVSGAFSTIQIVGAAFGVTIVGVILFDTLCRIETEAVSTLATTGAYGAAFAIATVYNFVAIVLGLALLSWLHGAKRQPG
ncbi:MFS transporter [Labrys sp. KB_33_2]|uniref:MFS transporter n=1 Tax=Labrys sp. KB_33_2 TaxID=3237479 RepID=UPI003F90ACD5